jgi:hypothetical protein
VLDYTALHPIALLGIAAARTRIVIRAALPGY